MTSACNLFTSFFAFFFTFRCARRRLATDGKSNSVDVYTCHISDDYLSMGSSVSYLLRRTFIIICSFSAQDTNSIHKLFVLHSKYYVWNRSYCPTTCRRHSIHRDMRATPFNCPVRPCTLHTKRQKKSEINERREKKHILQFGNFCGCIIGCWDISWLLFVYIFHFSFFSLWDDTRTGFRLEKSISSARPMVSRKHT